MGMVLSCESCIEICNMYLLGDVYLEHLTSQASASWFELLIDLNFLKKKFQGGSRPPTPLPVQTTGHI